MLPDVSKLSLNATRPATTNEFYTMSRQEAQYRTIVGQRDPIVRNILKHDDEKVELFRLPAEKGKDGKWTYNLYDAKALWRRIADETPHDSVKKETREEARAAGRVETWTGWVDADGRQVPLRPAPRDPVTNQPIRREDWVVLNERYGLPEELLEEDKERDEELRRYPEGRLAEPEAIAWREDVPPNPTYAEQTFESQLQQTDKLRRVFNALLANIDDLEEFNENVKKMKKLIDAVKDNERVFRDIMQRTYHALVSDETFDEKLAKVHERLSTQTQQLNQLLNDDGETLEGWDRIEQQTYGVDENGNAYEYTDIFWEERGTQRVLRYRPTEQNFKWQSEIDAANSLNGKMRKQLRTLTRTANERSKAVEKLKKELSLVEERDTALDRKMQSIEEQLRECKEKLEQRAQGVKRSVDELHAWERSRGVEMDPSPSRRRSDAGSSSAP